MVMYILQNPNQAVFFHVGLRVFPTGIHQISHEILDNMLTFHININN